MSKTKHGGMGSLRWGCATNGVLSGEEARELMDNLQWVVSQEAIDAERLRLGLLRPIAVEVETLRPPDTSVVREAIAYAQEAYELPLLRHCWRSYYFAALFGRHDGVGYDPELLAASALLHDLGLTSASGQDTCHCCFAVSGALAAQARLLERGIDPDQAAAVAKAISLHLNLRVSLEEHGALAHLTARGAVCDAFGPGLSRIAVETVRAVLQEFPRAGIEQHLGPEVFTHLEGSRPELILRALKESRDSMSKHPLEAPPFVE